MFTDIEGSTALLSRLGPAYADALGRMRRVLRDAWAAYGGVELGTEGDSFFVAFETAPEAVGGGAGAAPAGGRSTGQPMSGQGADGCAYRVPDGPR